MYNFKTFFLSIVYRIRITYALSFASLFLFWVLISSSICHSGDGIDEDPNNEVGTIEISAQVSKIKWDENIIRTWNAEGDVKVTYSRGEKLLICTAKSAIFTRDGVEKPFIDKVILEGDVEGDITGISIRTQKLILQNMGDSFYVESPQETEIFDAHYTLTTQNLLFNASDGIGSFPNGARLEFTVDNMMIAESSENDSQSRNFFADCLRVDVNGGVLNAPELELQYKVGIDEEYDLERVMFKSGATLEPIYKSDEIATKMRFGQGELDFGQSRITARNNISFENGPCKISSEQIDLDWNARKMKMEGNVVVSRALASFEAGKIDISWDDQGNLSLLALESPTMTITIPEETTEELLGNP